MILQAEGGAEEKNGGSEAERSTDDHQEEKEAKQCAEERRIHAGESNYLASIYPSLYFNNKILNSQNNSHPHN